MNSNQLRSIGILAAFLFQIGASIAATQPPRRVLLLDGAWQIAEGKMDQAPATFERTVPVPGLASLATPAFADPPGPKVAARGKVPQKDPQRDAFWYRRRFRLDQPVPAVALLKVHKAMFGTRVILNGQVLGDHLPSFTPGYFNARLALKTGANELLIRVGADRDAVGPAIPSGFDFEKERYIPGIFDSVELILSGTPHFTQTRFGMRDFKFDPATGRAMLNGKKYFMRGSNFTLYRFFEDSECQDLPWRKDWVRRLHQRVKEFESHPYHFNPNFRLRNLATADPVPQGNQTRNDGKHAVIINEYGWHWVNRDGTPTTLTRDIYRSVLGENATAAQRFHLQATWLAADTEFWRAHRKAAAVVHFTMLGYSRPDGQTCDHWNSQAFAVQVSRDGKNWTDVFTEENGKGGVSEIKFAPVETRHVRISCTKRGTQWGHAIRELQVFE